jgi:butyrate kinase
MFHALNQKAVARRACGDLDLEYREARLIVAHLGGGISVGVHCGGRVVDVSNALAGEGPFSPERSGGLPVMDVIRLKERDPGVDVQRLVNGEGGLKSYLGTADVQAVEAMIEAGDSYAVLVYDAMCYQIAREIAGSAAVLCGEVDAVIITGGLARSERLVNRIRERVAFLADILVYPGEDEMLALVEGALRVLEGGEEPLHYCGVVHRECLGSAGPGHRLRAIETG